LDFGGKTIESFGQEMGDALPWYTAFIVGIVKFEVLHNQQLLSIWELPLHVHFADALCLIAAAPGRKNLLDIKHGRVGGCSGWRMAEKSHQPGSNSGNIRPQLSKSTWRRS
jgi:hypothetical protein